MGTCRVFQAVGQPATLPGPGLCIEHRVEPQLAQLKGGALQQGDLVLDEQVPGSGDWRGGWDGSRHWPAPLPQSRNRGRGQGRMGSFCEDYSMLLVASNLCPSQPSQAGHLSLPLSPASPTSGTPHGKTELGTPSSLAPSLPTPCTATDPQPMPWLPVPGLRLPASVSPLGVVASLASLE